MTTLAVFLKQRAERNFRLLVKEVSNLTPEEALYDRHSGWPDHRWGIGQNGSIAGIVYHVAAWKQMTLPLFQPEGRAGTREEFDASSAPAPDDWPGILAWLKQAGTAWHAQLTALSDEAFATTRLWEGHTITLTEYIIEMIEHDVYHLAQVEYLRQRHIATGQR
jgi:hypothetical protein